MELFILIALQFLMGAMSYKSPNIKVTPDVLTESRSLDLVCECPADITVSICYFYAKRERENQILKLSPSCQLNFTGAEVLLWAGVDSPVSLNIGCYYTVNVNGVQKPSHHSSPVTLTILDALLKPVISVKESNALLNIVCDIPVSVKADFICNIYTEDGPLTYRSHSQRTRNRKHFCQFYLSLDEIFTDKQTVTQELSCDYLLNIKPVERSPRSDAYTIIADKAVSMATSTLPGSTGISKNTFSFTTKRKTTIKGMGITVPLLSAGVGLLSVVIGVMCIYRCSEKYLYSRPMTNNSSKDSGGDDTLTMVIYSSSTWHPQTKLHLL